MEIFIGAIQMANALQECDSHSCLIMDECERYGSTWGCNGDCPIFARGLCKIEDVEAFRKHILETDDFENYSRDELNKLYPQLKLENK